MTFGTIPNALGVDLVLTVQPAQKPAALSGPWDLPWPTPTRGQRLRWWFEDRAWAVRNRLADRLEGISDRLRGLEPLGSTPLPVEPPPVVFMAAPPAPVPAPAPSFEEWAAWVAEADLARSIATRHDLDWGAVWNELGRVPAGFRPFFDTPQGWSVLDDYVGRVLAAHPDPSPLIPTQH